MSDALTGRTKKYFIGANTKSGFINYADTIFADMKRVYIIKGGPGTGKSTFMRRLAERAEEKGYESVYYYCSSDPTSLDAVTVPELGLAITDGTSPHICEARFPGAKEEYLNLGEFWNNAFLTELRGKIEEVTEKKRIAFSSAYKYLSVAGLVRDERESVLLRCYDGVKAEKAVFRLVKSFGRGGGYSLAPRQISSFGMNGSVCFDTYKELCDRIIYIKDKRGISPFIFDEIVKRASEQELETHISRDCLCRTDGLMFPEKGLAILLGDGERVINTERFIINERLSENRRRLRFLRSLESEIVDCALTELREAKECHFLLEDIYREAMDFDALEAMREAFIDRII